MSPISEKKTLNKLLNAMWPVGSIYMSVNSTSPANIIGGKWERIQDRFLLAAGSSYSAGATGGAAKHNHSTGDFKLTTSHIPAHTHGSKALSGTIQIRRGGNNGSTDELATTSGIISLASQNGAQVSASNSMITGTHKRDTMTVNATHEHTSVGGGAAHNHGNTGESNNLPPYLAVYIWKRTA